MSNNPTIRAKSLAAYYDPNFNPFKPGIVGTDPQDIDSYPGTLEAWSEMDEIETAKQALPAIWGHKISACIKNNRKVILYIKTNDITTDHAGLVQLKAIARLVEDFTDIIAVVHVDNTRCVYRIGQVLDDFDREETRGMLVMGRLTDAFTADPNDEYFCMNGVPANFAVNPYANIPEAPARPSYDVFPFKNKKGKVVKKTTKPRNAWIIFRASRHTAVKAANPGYATAHLSSFIKHEWVQMDSRLKDLFFAMARQESLMHSQLYPNFKVTARKSKDISRRRTHREPRNVMVAAGTDDLDAQQ